MKRGFTLIEILVTMAIISILAGIMVPASWKFWESQEIQTTKDRMTALKLAMVGDRNLIQNGIRTSYGFAGDNGELPFGNMTGHGAFKLLVDRPVDSYPNWNGPYLSGFDPATFTQDAWGRQFRYTLQNNLPGYANRYLSGEIRSAGPDGVFDNSDDITVELSIREVAPSCRMQGNLFFANLTGAFSTRIEVKFRDPVSGETVSSPACISTFPNFTTIIREHGSPINLPIGKINISGYLYKGTNCSTASFRGSSAVDYFISDNVSSILINLPPVTPAH